MRNPRNDSMIALAAATATVVVIIVASTQSKPIADAFSSLSSRLYLQVVLKRKKMVEETVVTAVFRYPVKSLKGIPMDDGATLGNRGFTSDRALMLVVPLPTPVWGHFKPGEATHRFLTQRQCPSFARVSVKIVGHQLMFSTPDQVTPSSITTSTDTNEEAPTYLATVWGSTVSVQDLGDEAASFFQMILNGDSNMPDDLKEGVRLVIQVAEDKRKPNCDLIPGASRSLTGADPQVSLADGFPLLITSEASLQELNGRLAKKDKKSLPMTQFRPNIVLKGTKPFAEDRIKVLQIGDVILYVINGCPRCKQSCTDQETGTVGEEPLATLRDFRQMTDNPELLYFGANAIPAAESIGKTIKCGDVVRILEYGEPKWSEG